MTPRRPSQPQAPRALFISWAKLRRADTIAERLGIPSFTVKYFYRGTPPLLTLWKYFLQTARTLFLLLRHRPRVVFVTSPPVFAVLPVYLYALLFRARYAIDCHSGCFLEDHWKRWAWLQRFLSRRAALNLVHNADNAREIEPWGCKLTVFPSLPPDLGVAGPAGAAETAGSAGAAGSAGTAGRIPAAPRLRPVAVYICSFKGDEPVETFLAAAREAPGVDFLVTGRAPADMEARLPANVKLTGFLGEDEYNGLLADTDLIIALTTRPGTLLYGAQEAIALEKPLVLSRTPTLESHFTGGAVFAENTPEGLRAAILDALARKDALAAAMAEFARRYRAEGEARVEEVRGMVGLW